MPDARALSDVAHSVGALAWMDCVHYAAHRRIDVEALGADVLLCSPYKFFGPHQGLGFAREDLLATWPADRVRPAGQTPPGHRFETGTQSHEALAGVLAAIDFIASLGEGADRRAQLDDAYRGIVAYETGLTAKMLDGLAEVPGMTLYGISDPARAGERTPTFTFTLPGITPRQVCEQLAERGILGWDGNYYALGIMDRLGLEGHGGATPPRLPPLHDRGRGRPHARSADGDRPRLSLPVGSAALCSCGPADVAELVDAHGSGPCGRKVVEVQVLSSALLLVVISVCWSLVPPSGTARVRGPSAGTSRTATRQRHVPRLRDGRLDPDGRRCRWSS